jgi:hypothetical protein
MCRRTVDTLADATRTPRVGLCASMPLRPTVEPAKRVDRSYRTGRSPHWIKSEEPGDGAGDAL